MTEFQLGLDGSVLGVQVMPSVEEAAADELYATATNAFLAKAILVVKSLVTSKLKDLSCFVLLIPIKFLLQRHGM